MVVFCTFMTPGFWNQTKIKCACLLELPPELNPTPPRVCMDPLGDVHGVVQISEGSGIF